MNFNEVMRMRERRRARERVAAVLLGNVREPNYVAPKKVRGKNEYIDWRII